MSTVCLPDRDCTTVRVVCLPYIDCTCCLSALQRLYVLSVCLKDIVLIRVACLPYNYCTCCVSNLQLFHALSVHLYRKCTYCLLTSLPVLSLDCYLCFVSARLELPLHQVIYFSKDKMCVGVLLPLDDRMIGGRSILTVTFFSRGTTT